MASNNFYENAGPMTGEELGISHYAESIGNNSHKIPRNKSKNTLSYRNLINSRGPGLTNSNLDISLPLNATKYATSLPLTHIDKAINILELYNSRGHTKSKNAQTSDLQSAILEIQKEINEIQTSHGGRRSHTHKRSSIHKKTRRHTRSRK